MLNLEENAKSSIKGRKGQLVQAKMAGNIGSLNVESTEIEVNDDLDIEIVTHHRGVNTIIDENVLEDRIVKSRKSFITRRLEKSASKRIERKKIKQQRKKIKSNANVAKSNNNEGQDNHWDMPISSNLTKSVVPCIECGTLNNSTNPYCTSCGTYLS